MNRFELARLAAEQPKPDVLQENAQRKVEAFVVAFDTLVLRACVALAKQLIFALWISFLGTLCLWRWRASGSPVTPPSWWHACDFPFTPTSTFILLNASIVLSVMGIYLRPEPIRYVVVSGVVPAVFLNTLAFVKMRKLRANSI